MTKYDNNLKKVLKPTILDYQLHRYKTKGFHLIISFILISFYFTIYPNILAKVWPYLYDCLPQIPLFVLVLNSLNILLLLCYSLMMYVIYTVKLPFLQKYRITQQAWPWQSDYQKWTKLLSKTIKTIALNSFVIGPLLLYADCQIQFIIKMKMEDIPESKFTYIWQFIVFFVVQEVLSFSTHFLLHHPKLYWIHKPHHQYIIPVSISGHYAHPLQYIFSSSLSIGMGFKVLSHFYPVHIFSIIIWMTYRIIETNQAHTGYKWPWSQSAIIPFNTGDNYHFYHHKFNIGNYGALTYVLDSLFNLNQSFWIYERKAQKKNNKLTTQTMKNNFEKQSILER